MEGIEEEIKQKMIERSSEDVVMPEKVEETKVVEKPKKPRSQKQIEAFEKARAKRAENLKKKQEQQELEPELPPENKTESPPKKNR